MKRVKIKSKKSHITITESKLKQIKWDATKEATDKACLVLLAAAVDVLKLDEDQIIKVMETTTRYVNYLDDHLVKIEDVRKTLEKAGISIRGWV